MGRGGWGPEGKATRRLPASRRPWSGQSEFWQQKSFRSSMGQPCKYTESGHHLTSIIESAGCKDNASKTPPKKGTGGKRHESCRTAFIACHTSAGGPALGWRCPSYPAAGW